MKRAILATILAASAAGCGDTGQPVLRFPAYGSGVAPHTVTNGDWELTLDVARVAFGPAVFCRSRASSDDLCPEALAEVRAASTIDALDPAPQPIGSVDGFVGTIRSAGFALGIAWFTTDTTKAVLPGAPGGHSAHLEGQARNVTDGRSFRFVADVDLAPLNRGDWAASAVGLNATIDTRTSRLDVRFDPASWLSQIDVDSLAALGVDPVSIARGTDETEPRARAANAIAVGLSSIAPPKFELSR